MRCNRNYKLHNLPPCLARPLACLVATSYDERAMRRLVLLAATVVVFASSAAYADAAAPKLETVPGVVGMMEKGAVKALAGRGFNIHVLLVNSRELVAGRVISEKPSTGRFPPGTTIYINVSAGPKPH